MYHSIRVDRTNKRGNLSGLCVGTVVEIDEFVENDCGFFKTSLIGLNLTKSLWSQLWFCSGGYLCEVKAEPQTNELDWKGGSFFDPFPRRIYSTLRREIVREWDLTSLREFCKEKLATIGYNYDRDIAIIPMCMLHFPEEVYQKALEITGIDRAQDEILKNEEYA